MLSDDNWEDVNEFVDAITMEEEATDMHHSLFQIPSSWQPINLKESKND